MLILKVDDWLVWTGESLVRPDGSPIPAGWVAAAALPVVGAGQYAILTGRGLFEVRTGAPGRFSVPAVPQVSGGLRSPLDFLDRATEQYVDRAGPGVPPPFGVTATVREVGSGWLGNVTTAQGAVPVPVPTPYLPRDKVVHPNVLEFYSGWNGWRYVMALTAYSHEIEENPYLVASNDLQTWVMLTGILADVPKIPTAHNSDPYLAYDPRSASIILMWRESIKTSEVGRVDTLYYRQTKDGTNWTSPKLVKGPHYAGDKKLSLSPSLIFNTSLSRWFLYVFDQATTGGGQALWTYSSKTLGGAWEVESETKVEGLSMWHGEVKLVGNRLVVLIYSMTANQLYFGVSLPGSWKDFTVSTNPVVTGVGADGMYKASFLPEYSADDTQLAFNIIWTSNAGSATPEKRWRMYIGKTNFASAVP